MGSPAQLEGRSFIHPLFGRCIVNKKGYPRIWSGEYRGMYLHRAVWEHVSGKKLPDGWHVHHQNHNKLCWCPSNLIALPAEFNPIPEQLRCPYTGVFMTQESFERRYGK